MCFPGPIPIDRSRHPPQPRYIPRAPIPHNPPHRGHGAIFLPTLALPRSARTRAGSPGWPMRAGDSELARPECAHERDEVSNLRPVDQRNAGGRNSGLGDFTVSAFPALDDPAEAAHHADERAALDAGIPFRRAFLISAEPA